MLAKDVLAKDVLAKDVLAKDVLAQDVLAQDVLAQDVLAKGVPAPDAVASDVPASDVPASDVPAPDVLAGLARALASGGAACIGTALTMLTDAVPARLVVRDAERSVIAEAGTSAGIYRLDVPLRSARTVVGTLTVTSVDPLATHALRLLAVAADVLALTLHLARASDAHDQALLDAEADRAEAAHDLHDGLFQTIVAAKHAVAVNAPATTVGAVLARALHESRRATSLLRPRAVDGDLCRALQGLASDLTATGSRVTVDAVTLPPLPPAIATLAYRVVTAAVREEIGAIRVQVRLIRAETMVVTISGMVDAMDTGAAARWHRRVQAAGGDLEVGVDRVRLELALPTVTTAMATVATLGTRR